MRKEDGGRFLPHKIAFSTDGKKKQMGQTFRTMKWLLRTRWRDWICIHECREADIEPQHGPDVMNLAERTDASRTLYCWIPWFKWHQTQLHLPVDSNQSFLLRCDILSEFLITLVRKMCFNKRDILEKSHSRRIREILPLLAQETYPGVGETACREQNLFHEPFLWSLL